MRQQRVGSEALKRPQYQTPQFGKQLDKITYDKLAKKQQMVISDFVLTHTNLNTKRSVIVCGSNDLCM